MELKAYLRRPGEQDGNEPEIFAPILDELILELHHTDVQKINRGQMERCTIQPRRLQTCLCM